jgi:hypothetical protein
MNIFGLYVSPREKRILRIVGWWGGGLLLFVWGAWWLLSFIGMQFFLRQEFGFPSFVQLGVDFFHNFGAASLWMKGGDPYLQSFGDSRGLYTYPPILLPMFSWCAGLTIRGAIALWFIAACAMLTVCLVIVQFDRERLKLAVVPWTLTAALVLWSMPVLFELERGQCDVISLLMLCIAVWALARCHWAGDVAAGVLVALAAWIKIYPALMIPGLFVLRRYTAGGAALVAVVLIGFVCHSIEPNWISEVAVTQNDRVNAFASTLDWIRGRPVTPPQYSGYAPYQTFSHSITNVLPETLAVWGYESFASVPWLMPVALFAGGWIIFVSWSIFKCLDRDRLYLSFLLWLCLMATLVLPVSYDYNLLYAPFFFLALLASPRSTRWYAITFVTALLWLQPMNWFTSPMWSAIFKIAPVFLMGVVLVMETRVPGGQPIESYS